VKSSIAIHITEPQASSICCKMVTFSWTHVIYVKNEHNRHIHYSSHCTFTSLNLHLVFNTMLPMSYQKYTKNPCLYTNYHTFLSPEILHEENVLLSVKYVNCLAKPNIISTTFLLQYTKSVIKIPASLLKLHNFKHLHSVLTGTKQKLVQCFQLTYN
jgi:hypothetical protein